LELLLTHRHHNGDGTFKDITYSSGAAYSEDGKPEAGMSADAADLTGRTTLIST
jgi:hypothetical protein